MLGKKGSRYVGWALPTISVGGSTRLTLSDPGRMKGRKIGRRGNPWSVMRESIGVGRQRVAGRHGGRPLLNLSPEFVHGVIQGETDEIPDAANRKLA